MSTLNGKNSESWKDKPQMSNLILQILLFLNVYLSAFWIPIYGYYIVHLVYSFGTIQRILTILGYIIGMPGEILRLYLGYSGNLKGKISDLAGFWILSTLIELPIQLYFLLTLDDWTVVSYLQYLMVFLLLLEVPIGAYASHKLSTHQAQQYRVELIAKLQK